MNTKKILLALMVVFVLLSANALAITTSIQWDDGTTSKTITSGSSATFKAQVKDTDKPIYVKIDLKQDAKIIKNIAETTSYLDYESSGGVPKLNTLSQSDYLAPGTYDVWLYARDKADKSSGFESKNSYIKLIVTKKPLKLTSNIPDISIQEDTSYLTNPLTYYFDYDETDYDSLVFTPQIVEGNSDDVKITITDNRATITPRADFFGTIKVKFTASATGQSVDSNVVTINVANVNDAPIISTSSLPDAKENILYTQEIKASDIDGDKLTFSLISSPSRMSIDSSSGIIKWTPSDTDGGKLHDVKVKITDGKLSAEKAYSLNVIDVPLVNKAPIINSFTADSTSKLGESYFTFTANAADPDGDSSKLKYEFDIDGKAGYEIDNGNSNVLTRKFSKGAYTIGVKVTDVKGGIALASLKITATNNAPTIKTFSPSESKVTVSEKSSKEFSVIAEDKDISDSGKLVYSWKLGGKVVSSSAGYIFTTDYNSARDYTLDVSVSDGTASTVKSWEVYVTDINSAPRVSFSGATSITDEQELELVVSSTDAEGDAIHFNAPKTLITGYTFTDISSTQKLFKWKPLKGTGGTFPIRFEADDGKLTGFADANIIVTTVTPKNNPPTADFTYSPANPKVNQDITFTSTSKDNDIGDFIAKYSWDFNADGIADAGTQIAVYKYSVAGNYNAKLTVTDSKGESNSISKSIIISKTDVVNNAPIADFTYSPANPIAGQTINFDGSASNDTEGDQLIYSWTFPDGKTSSDIKPTFVFDNAGNYDITLRVTEKDTLAKKSASKTKTIVVSPKPKSEITSLSCFENVVKDAKQSCSVEVKAYGQPIGDATAKIYFSDGSSFGQCQTDSITGACRAERIMTQEGDYIVYATSEKSGFISDLDNQPTFSFRVLRHRYDIEDLKVYSDVGFTTEDYDFFRGENLYTQFRVKDLSNGQYVSNDIVTKVTLVSKAAGGSADLNNIGISSGFYRYKLTPIPLQHGFKGQSQIFTFAFNFADDSGGEKDIQLNIKNNPPQIIGNIPDVRCEAGNTCTIQLASFESDKEDFGNDLRWSVSSINTNLFDGIIDGKTLKITGKQDGIDDIGLALSDLDGDTDNETIIQMASFESGRDSANIHGCARYRRLVTGKPH